MSRGAVGSRRWIHIFLKIEDGISRLTCHTATKPCLFFTIRAMHLGFLRTQGYALFFQHGWGSLEPCQRCCLRIAILGAVRSVMTRARNMKWKRQRVENFTLETGLSLWITHNRRALENSKGLCRVITSNENILENPLNEVWRISDELTSKCHVRPPPQHLKESVKHFISTRLQHAIVAVKVDVLLRYGKCSIHNYDGKYSEGTVERQREDLRNGYAFDKDYNLSI